MATTALPDGPAPRPARANGPALASAVAALLILAGCANTVSTQPLATGTPGQAAYALSGPDPESVRQEALRLCQGGAEVLRESYRAQDAAPANGRLARWWTTALQLVDPPTREAQLVVRCDARPEGNRLSATLPLPLADAGSATSSRSRGRGRSAKPAVDADVPYGY